MTGSILLVDSDRDFLEQLSLTLLRLDFEVTIAYQPRQACAALAFKSFDLALMADKLSATTGLELAQQLRRRLPQLCTILLCDQLQPAFETKAKRQGVFACLLKPFENWLLEEMLELAFDSLASAAPAPLGQSRSVRSQTEQGEFEAHGLFPLIWSGNDSPRSN